ncbi:MAG: hydroxyethylthiazole kinase [Rhodobacteraceae bacterium]|nr:hydroxyethylthiazole kinase [Paracoccaceae bacterium]MBR9820072.1 hydroxyethylthiazole kinase [Paracoccaceae bacterium]
MTDWGTPLTAMRDTAPLVHCMTNYVSMNIMANVLLASGASPAMVPAEDEAAEFTGITSALAINIGTLSQPWLRAMEASARVAGERGIPWVLDPVAVGATAFRNSASTALLKLSPPIIKGNASEVIALAGIGAGITAKGKGADAVHGVDAAIEPAIELARQSGAVVAVTGPEDFITDGATHYRVANGDALMPKVTALGCALGGVVGAFAASGDRLQGTVAALAYYGLAGEIAAEGAEGPGSFAMRFVDALAQIDAAQLTERARVRAA